jgi:hypothetical protein
MENDRKAGIKEGCKYLPVNKNQAPETTAPYEAIETIQIPGMGNI